MIIESQVENTKQLGKGIMVRTQQGGRGMRPSRVREIEYPELKLAKAKAPLNEGGAKTWHLSEVQKTPTLILVGSPTRSSEVAVSLATMGLNIVKVQYAKEMLQALDDSVVGVVYVLPLQRSHVLSVHKNIKKQAKVHGFDFFAISPAWVTARTEREMYRIGIKMVFDWSREKKTFETLMSQALTTDLKKVASSDIDKSLKKALENRLRTSSLSALKRSLDITVYHGIALLRGQVESLQVRRQLSRLLIHTPGVRGVVDRSLRVKPHDSVIDGNHMDNSILNS